MTPNAPPPTTTAVGAQPGRYLTFTLGRESYGLPVLFVREIIRLCPITPVPRMPAYIRGVINLRGKIVPILDLRAKFGLAPATESERACIVVAQLGDSPGHLTLMGVIVDAVEEVVQLNAPEIEGAPDFGGSPDTHYILGMAKVRGAVKTLLDLQRIVEEAGIVSLPPSRSDANPS